MFEVFEGKRVLVTGHTGFKGAWLATWLDMLGAKVSGFSLSPLPYKSFWSACQSSSFIDEHFGDIRDEMRIAEVIRAVRPEFIFHLAAQPLGMASYEDPITTMTTNAMGTMHLLNALRGFDHAMPACAASITGYPKPSYSELTIAIELDAYSFAISSFVKSVLKKTLSFMPNSSISLDVWPPFFIFPMTPQ